MATSSQLKAMLDAPSLSAYADDPQWIAAAQAADALRARRRGVKALSRDDRRLLARYGSQMDEAVERARVAHEAYLAEHGLLDSE